MMRCLTRLAPVSAIPSDPELRAVVVLVDAYNTLFTGDPKTLLRKLLSSGHRVVFATQKTCCRRAALLLPRSPRQQRWPTHSSVTASPRARAATSPLLHLFLIPPQTALHGWTPSSPSELQRNCSASSPPLSPYPPLPRPFSPLPLPRPHSPPAARAARNGSESPRRTATPTGRSRRGRRPGPT